MDKYELMRFRDALLENMNICTSELRELYWNLISDVACSLKWSQIPEDTSQLIYDRWTYLKSEMIHTSGSEESIRRAVNVIDNAAQCCIAG